MRDRVRAIVEADPGVHVRQIASLLGIHHSTARHHIHVLEREGHITVRRVDGKSACFDRAHGRIDSKAPRGALHDAALHAAARAVLNAPGSTLEELGAALDASTATMRRRVKRLAAAGLVTGVPMDGTVEVFPAAALRPSLLEHQAMGEPLGPRTFDGAGIAP